MKTTLETYTPVHGESFTVKVNTEKFNQTLSEYRRLYPLDTREFADMSSDIQHAIIKVAR